MLFIPGIIMLGIVFTTPFTLPDETTSQLVLFASSLGLLTSLPLLTFAIFSQIQFVKSWELSASFS